jgi:hypothetical protein
MVTLWVLQMTPDLMGLFVSIATFGAENDLTPRSGWSWFGLSIFR